MKTIFGCGIVVWKFHAQARWLTGWYGIAASTHCEGVAEVDADADGNTAVAEQATMRTANVNIGPVLIELSWFRKARA